MSHVVVESTAEVIEPFVTRFVKRVMRIWLTITLVIVVLLLVRAIVRSRRRRHVRRDERSPVEDDTMSMPLANSEALEPVHQRRRGEQLEAPEGQPEGKPDPDLTES